MLYKPDLRLYSLKILNLTEILTFDGLFRIKIMWKADEERTLPHLSQIPVVTWPRLALDERTTILPA